MILSFKDIKPLIASDVFIAPDATIIGDVQIGHKSSVWFHTCIRGDVNHIRIGEESNIQDNSTLHVQRDSYPLIVGNRVTIGHNAILHGCVIHDEVLIGMGAILMNGAEIGKHSIIAAGALIPENMHIPEGSLVIGVPAKMKRKIKKNEIELINESAINYYNLQKEYR